MTINYIYCVLAYRTQQSNKTWFRRSTSQISW